MTTISLAIKLWKPQFPLQITKPYHLLFTMSSMFAPQQSSQTKHLCSNMDPTSLEKRCSERIQEEGYFNCRKLCPQRQTHNKCWLEFHTHPQRPKLVVIWLKCTILRREEENSASIFTIKQQEHGKTKEWNSVWKRTRGQCQELQGWTQFCCFTLLMNFISSPLCSFLEDFSFFFNLCRLLWAQGLWHDAHSVSEALPIHPASPCHLATTYSSSDLRLGGHSAEIWPSLQHSIASWAENLCTSSLS